MKLINKAEKSWIMYDWANSSFATTIMAGFFPLFFQKYWSAGESTIDVTTRLGLTLSVSGFLASVLTLVLGPITDQKGHRKNWTIVFAAVAIISIFLFYFFGEGEWQLPLFLYGAALTGFTLSCNFYDSLLPHVISKKDDAHIGWVSSLGYGFGYLGGGVLFAVNVFIFLKPEWFGLDSGVAAVKVSFLSVVVWWSVFSIPFIKNVREGRNETKDFLLGKEIVGIFKLAYQRKKIFYFLLAFWFYIDGVYTVMSMAVDFATGIGLEGKHLMAALLMTQFIAFPATLITSWIAKHWSVEKTLVALLVVYIFTVLGATRLTSATEFFILAAMIGLAQGGVQALSRSQLALLIPHHESGKWYALMNMVGRFAAILGPLVVAITTKLTHSHHAGVGSIALLLVVGIYFLFKSVVSEDVSESSR